MDNATLALILACISLGVHALDKILHLVAPRTKTTLDDRAVALLDKLEALLLKFGGPTIIVLAIGAASLAACTWLRSTGKEVAQGAVDCTKGAAADAVKQFAPLVENQLAGTVDGEGPARQGEGEGAAPRLRARARRLRRGEGVRGAPRSTEA
jgi:hypothetical protein